MTGAVKTASGAVKPLPEALRWELCRTDGTAADCFQYTCTMSAGLAETLRQAVQFQATEGGKRVFTGLVDEFETSFGSGGVTVTVTGRGMAARLMDNETQGAEFFVIQLADILRRYVTPYGITAVLADKLPVLSYFSVATGGTCWQALEGFCRHAGGIQPRFLANGTLELRAAPKVGRHEIYSSNVLRASRRFCRYGVISKQTITTVKTGALQTAENRAFQALGGLCQKVDTRSGDFMHAGFRTAQQRVADAARQMDVVELTQPGSFLAEPRDLVWVSLPQIEVAATYIVQEVRSSCTPDGRLCTLVLRKGG